MARLHIVAVVLLGVAFGTAGCDGAPTAADAIADVPLPAGFSRAEVSGDDGPVRLSLSVPEGLAASRPVPLVVALHWAGEVTPFYGETYLRTLAAPGLADLGAIVVAPDRLGRDWDTTESQALIRSLVEGARRHWPVDPARVVVTGYSMGGFGTWATLDASPDLFAAGISMAAYPISDGAGRPVYVIHGTRDELYAFESTKWAVERHVREGRPLVFAPAEGLTHLESAAYVPALREAARWLETEVW